jgi:hypothetical protein
MAPIDGADRRRTVIYVAVTLFDPWRSAPLISVHLRARFSVVLRRSTRLTSAG